ncbi:MAG: DUF3006 domain-containing protein [Oscillospiraceae bacterium]|nr:DUF3006 domain-containing protein [Oscillospiraceae bacterium]
MMLIIDRFEEDFAVVETGKTGEKTATIKRTLLPNTAKEGDVLLEINGVFEVDETATKHRRDAALQKLRKIINKE